jgi:hypothetical protein
MAYWDGERWIDERAPVRKERSRGARALMHTSQALLEGGLIAVLVGGLVVGTAFAGRGGSQVTPSIALNSVSGTGGALSAASQAALGDYVTFTTVVPKNVNNPRIEVLCYQGEELVYGEAGAIGDAFLLGGGGSTWKDRGGPAECDANLYYFSWKANTPTSTQLATTHFSADG